MKIGLDKSSKKFICPACGKRRFVRYFNFDTTEYFPDEYGRCDREMSCGYHNAIGSYLKGQNQSFTYAPAVRRSRAFSKIDIMAVSESVNQTAPNNFVGFLQSLFDKKTVQKLIDNYQLGTSNHWNGATIFWQIDEKKDVRSGKILLYNPKTGKRVKKPYNHINWYHKTAKLQFFELKQCLFGIHLAKKYPQKPIAIVESEKTAVIMSAVMPESLWLATGSLSNLKPSLFYGILDRKIILYPDTSLPNNNRQTCYELWQDKAEKIRTQGFDIEISDLLEKNTTKQQKVAGLDIADFFIPQLLSKTVNYKGQSTKTVELKSINQQKLEKFRSKNPEIDILINIFDLDLS